MRKKILLIDCFDSFTFNLKHYLEQFSLVDVIRIDQINVSKIGGYDAFVLSPGPKLPSDYPTLFKILTQYADTHPILGVCLGMQAIAEYFGGQLSNLKEVKHGLSEPLFDVDTTCVLYASLKPNILVARYHSWVVNETKSLNSAFHITSRSELGDMMSFKHRSLPIYGVQFHPESIMTPQGLELIKNWVGTL